MNNTFLIISREYATRVRKKSFILITILLPVLMAALVVLPLLLVMHNEKTRHTEILVVDDTEMFINTFQNTENTTFHYLSGDINELKQYAINGKYDIVFHILPNTQSLRSNLYYRDNLPAGLQSTLESRMNTIFFDRILQDTFNIEPTKFEHLQQLTKVNITSIQIDKEGNERESMAAVNQIVGMGSGLVIYFVIVFFASQVLRGVLEEKTNRIVEILISSVKPVQLLIGKIVGIALVGITQFLIWLVLTFGILFAVQLASPALFSDRNATEIVMSDTTGSPDIAGTPADLSQTNAGINIFQEINRYFSISFSQLILCFLFFFIVGYLIYAALYAATGSVVDNESDSQQYTMPVTIPLILSIVLVPAIANNPSGQLGFWFSMIPLTSPIVMLVRLPAGVPLWQLLLSMGIAVLFLVFCIWFAAKIYRTGILMYGKKSSWKEIMRWLKKS